MAEREAKEQAEKEALAADKEAQAIAEREAQEQAETPAVQAEEQEEMQEVQPDEQEKEGELKADEEVEEQEQEAQEQAETQAVQPEEQEEVETRTPSDWRYNAGSGVLTPDQKKAERWRLANIVVVLAQLAQHVPAGRHIAVGTNRGNSQPGNSET